MNSQDIIATMKNEFIAPVEINQAHAEFAYRKAYWFGYMAALESLNISKPAVKAEKSRISKFMNSRLVKWVYSDTFTRIMPPEVNLYSYATNIKETSL